MTVYRYSNGIQDLVRIPLIMCGAIAFRIRFYFYEIRMLILDIITWILFI